MIDIKFAVPRSGKRKEIPKIEIMESSDGLVKQPVIVSETS
jgi:hypothetical protein